MSMIYRCAFHRVQISQVQLFVMKVSLKNHILFFQVLSIIVDTDPEKEELPNVIDCRFGRSNQSNAKYHINTSNHKGIRTKVKRLDKTCTNVDGL